MQITFAFQTEMKSLAIIEKATKLKSSFSTTFSNNHSHCTKNKDILNALTLFHLLPLAEDKNDNGKTFIMGLLIRMIMAILLSSQRCPTMET